MLIKLHTGDVAAIPVDVRHWHGAANDRWFAHIAIEFPGENTSNEWLEPVSEEEYRKLRFPRLRVDAVQRDFW